MMRVQFLSCLLVLQLLLTLVTLSGAQDSACLNQLVPCLQYINTKQAPPSSCCDPLWELIKSDPKCLCSMLGGSSAKQAGVNMTQAQFLPTRCGKKVNAALCKSSPKTKTKFSSSAGELPLREAVVTATASVIIQAIWASVMS